MSASGRSPSLESSLMSTNAEICEELEIANARNYAKSLLKSRIFLGRYVERRLINQRIGYRDIVIVSDAEVELKRDLINIQIKLRSAYPQDFWIGISDSEFMEYSSSVCLATEIDNQPLGPFWFQIKSVKFRDVEIIIMLKCVRHISDAYLEVEPILTGKINKISTLTNKSTTDRTFNESANDIVESLKNALTVNNVKEFLTFIFAFVIAIFTGSTSFVNFLGNFMLALVRELSILIKNSTPMFLGVLDFFSKIVGGFYILLAMFFKPNNSLRSTNKRAVPYYAQRQNQFDYRNFD